MANEFIARNGLIAQSDSTISGSLNISGSITSIGTLTAQTLVVQTITSSIDYVTGSSRFGNLLANTHVFTGSISMTGSLNVIGGITGSFQGTVTTASYALNAVSASYASTASYVLNAISSSYAAITSANVTTALGYTPYNATNPNGYTTNTGTVTGVTGTAPVVSSGGTAPAISMAAASSGVNGYMTGVYATKLDGIATGATANTGTVTGVTGTSPVVSSGGTAPAISMAAASSGVNGYMTGVYATKLDGIAAGATNVTNTNQLTNGAGYITSAGTATSLSGGGGSSITRTAAGTSYSTMYQIREASGYSGNTAIAGAPALGFHWGGVVASSILMESSGRISIRDNPGTGYEAFIASTIYANSSFQGNLTGNVTGNVSGTAGSISGYGNPTTSATANTIVYRDANGYITNNYFYASSGGAERNASGMGYFAGHNTGDYYYRSYTAAAAAALLSGQSMNIAGNATTATTAARATRANGYFYIDDNYGCSIIGVYSSTVFQGVFAMGDAYKLTAAGGISNLYGLAWSHPNAGGQAANLSSHGLLVVVNGTTYAAISSNIWISGTYYGSGAGLTGTASSLSIGGTAGNITAYTINQNLGTLNAVYFDSITAANNIRIGIGSPAAYGSITMYGSDYGSQYWGRAQCRNSDGNFWLSTRTNSATWFDNIRMNSSGVTVYGTFTNSSDIRFKTNIETITGALGKVLEMRGVTFNRVERPEDPKELGFIAQELLPIIPEVVQKDYKEIGNTEDFTYSVSYHTISALLIEGMKELNAKLEAANIQIENLKQLIK